MEKKKIYANTITGRKTNIMILKNLQLHTLYDMHTVVQKSTDGVKKNKKNNKDQTPSQLLLLLLCSATSG